MEKLKGILFDVLVYAFGIGAALIALALGAFVIYVYAVYGNTPLAEVPFWAAWVLRF